MAISKLGGKGPLVQEHLSDAYARLGGTAEFEVRISGEPKPDITWYGFLHCWIQFCFNFLIQLTVQTFLKDFALIFFMS